MLIDRYEPAVCLLKTTCATTPTPKTIRMNVPRNSASASRRSDCDIGPYCRLRSPMPYILALDQGTTSSRAMLFDRDGRMCGMAQKEFTQIFPQAGWVEHDAREIWASQIGVAIEALERAQAKVADVAAVGITKQRETTAR